MGGIAMVVLSLLLVVFELRQNTNALRGSTFDAITEHGQFELYWSSEIAPIVVKAIQDPSQLDVVESFRLGEWLTSAMNARQNEFVQYQLGLIDERSWETLENVIQVMLGYEWAREWWSIYGTNFVNREFVAKVDELMEGSTFDYAQTLEELSEIGSTR
jgi:hypothetical protein